MMKHCYLEVTGQLLQSGAHNIKIPSISILFYKILFMTKHGPRFKACLLRQGEKTKDIIA